MQLTTISRAKARQIYDQLGHGLDRSARFEAHAKAHALELLAVQPGQHVLHVGVGTGGEHAALQAAAQPGGTVVGYDLSLGMLRITQERTATPLCAGDAVRLPFAVAAFDRLFSAYVLDLLPLADIPLVLAEFRRVLRPAGQLVLVGLTEGVDWPSRAFVAGWNLAYQVRPEALGGCRPLHVSSMLRAAGFDVQRQVIVQRGFPSEVVIGR